MFEASGKSKPQLFLGSRTWTLWAAKNHGVSAKLGLRFPASLEHGLRPARSVSPTAMNRYEKTLQGDSDGQGIRRDRHGRALRRFTDRHVAGAQGLPGA